jgi:2-polyprenyl-6-methoxyphenol hydroxylase-like FAD-dependent oxidoreductase
MFAGVGINLAVQDAVALANIVGPHLRRGERVDDALLHEVQKRRERPTKWTQWMQDRIQRAVFEHVLSSSTAPPMPLVIRLLERSKLARRIPARLVGVGFRPEHVAT